MSDAMNWTQAVSLLSEIAQQEDGCALKMGDHLNYIEREWGGRSKAKLAAQEAGVTWALARQRSWVAKRIPPGHSLRDTHLSYSHLRAVANTDDPEKWGNLALAHNWSVATLKEEIEKAGARQAVDEGRPCACCEQAMTDESELISIRIGRERSTLYCSLACVATVIETMLREGQNADPLDLEAFTL